MKQKRNSPNKKLSKINMLVIYVIKESVPVVSVIRSVYCSHIPSTDALLRVK
jgi:hypothetical protein